jgi:hypothetical protein
MPAKTTRTFDSEAELLDHYTRDPSEVGGSSRREQFQKMVEDAVGEKCLFNWSGDDSVTMRRPGRRGVQLTCACTEDDVAAAIESVRGAS